MSDATDKLRFPRALACGVARVLVRALGPHCERLIVAGSLRRKKAEVGDVEIVYVPRTESTPNPAALFGDEMITINHADGAIAELLRIGFLEKRRNVLGSEMWGAQNKLALAALSRVPVDLFATTAANWWNYVVCRTGGSVTNVAICDAAIRRGLKWTPYGEGFSRAVGLGREVVPVSSEEEVFSTVGLPWLAPEERP